jgi:hypothetical protein
MFISTGVKESLTGCSWTREAEAEEAEEAEEAAVWLSSVNQSDQGGDDGGNFALLPPLTRFAHDNCSVECYALLLREGQSQPHRLSTGPFVLLISRVFHPATRGTSTGPATRGITVLEAGRSQGAFRFTELSHDP